ncbi:MAG: hypothetical protein R3C62_23770 [Chloroflexota bacterium]
MKRYMVLLLFWLLVACTPTVAPVAVTRGVQTAVTTPPLPTLTPATTPAALASMVPTATAFPVPTITPPATATTAVFPLPTPTATPNAASDVQILWTATSPGGAWTATTSYDVPEGYDQFQTQFWLTNADSGAAWLLLDELRPLGMGYTTPKVIGWGEGEMSVYFTEAGQADGGGIFEYHHGLWRGSLLDGSVTELVPEDTADVAVTGGGEGETAVSAAYNSPDLLIHDLATGAVEAVPLPAPFDLIGGLVWSPSGSQLAVTLVSNPFDSRHTIVHYRRADWQPTILLADDTTDRFVTEGWDDETTLLLHDQAGQPWQLDVVSGEYMRLPRN